MPIAHVSTSTALEGGTATLTVSHTIASGDGRCLVVSVGGSLTANTVTGVTYNGVAMTAAGQSVQGAYRGSQWVMASPPVGTFDAVATYSGNSGGTHIVATNFTGVDSSTPQDTTAVSAGATDNTTRSTDITTVTNNAWLVDCLIFGGAAPEATPTSPQTELAEPTGLSTRIAVSYKEVTTAGASSMGQTWTTTSASSHGVVALRPAGASASQAPMYYSRKVFFPV